MYQRVCFHVSLSLPDSTPTAVPLPLRRPPLSLSLDAPPSLVLLSPSPSWSLCLLLLFTLRSPSLAFPSGTAGSSPPPLLSVWFLATASDAFVHHIKRMVSRSHLQVGLIQPLFVMHSWWAMTRWIA